MEFEDCFLNCFTNQMEFYGNSVLLDPATAGAECTQFNGPSFQLDIPIRRLGSDFPFISPAKVQMHRIVRELCAFRSRLARVEMNRISREFNSFGLTKESNSEMAPKEK